jgi:glycosyltransferase involved in cell wall biosynthesis
MGSWIGPSPLLTPDGGAGLVTIDMQAAQSPAYRDRGIARYAKEFTAAMVARHPDLVDQVVLNPSLPSIGGVDRLATVVPVTTAPAVGGGGVFHVLSPFELDVPLDQLWPRWVSRAEKRLVVTVYDIIPELFPDLYLRDPGQRRRYRARRELVRAADHILTLSRSAAQDVVTHLGLPPDRVTMVGAAPSDHFVPAADRAGAFSRVSQEVDGLKGRYIVYNGGLEPRKNMEGLIEAYALLPEEVMATWQLVVVCRMPDSARHHYVVRAEQLGISGRLILTGYVSDASLALLYQAADLAVCPSLYEGYGYPVAEARACGAPAIASDVSSLVELVAPGATFDPAKPAAIAEAMERALTDPAVRAGLVEWSARPVDTWTDVVDRAAEVYRRVGQPPVPVRTWSPRPRLALVSPWPPAATGVAVYNEQLVRALDRYADIDLYEDGDTPAAGSAAPSTLPSADLAVGGYDAVILALGNSEFHAGALGLLRRWDRPCVVQAHDIRLVDAYLHGAPRGAVPEGFEAAVAKQYPDRWRSLVVDGRIPSADADGEGIFMLEEGVARSERFLVTSEVAAAIARLQVPIEDQAKIAVWPYAYPEAFGRSSDMVDRNLVCSFGLVNESKAPDVLVDAVALLAPAWPEVTLAFIGPVGDRERAWLTCRAEAAGIGGAVEFGGRVDDGEYHAWLARAGLAVQLRRWTSGEVSGGVADCFAHAVPTVITDLGPQSELAGVAAIVPAAIDAAGLARVLGELLADPAQAERIGHRGLAHAAERNFDWAARKLWEVVPTLQRSPGLRL